MADFPAISSVFRSLPVAPFARAKGSLAVAILLLAPSVSANGRFPNAQILREPSPGALALVGTYGLLVSANAGTDFQYVCESELFSRGAMGDWIDPLLEAYADGTLLTGSRHALRVTRDRGCSFTTDWSLPIDPLFSTPPAGTAFQAGAVVDLCRAVDGTSAVIALGAVSAPSGAIQSHQLYRALPSEPFRAFGKPIPFDVAPVTLTLDAAPGRPARFYVSASKAGQALLLVTDDAGESWTAKPILPEDAADSEAYIGAVSPTNPDRVYVRLRRQAETNEGSTTWEDTLVVSDDAGSSFREVLRRQGSLLGFALSPDGKTVAAGYGDPREAPIVTLDTDLGLYSADADRLIFEPRVAELSVSCLYWNNEGLYACAQEVDPLGTDANAKSDFHLGVFRGSGVPTSRADFSSLLKLKDVRGPIPRTDGMGSACATEWATGDPADPFVPAACKMLNACDSRVPIAASALRCPGAPVAGVSGAGGQGPAGGSANWGGSGAVGGGSGTQGGLSSGGFAGNPPVAGAAGSGTAGNVAGSESDSTAANGCGCKVIRRKGQLSPSLLLFLLCLARRRSRRTVATTLPWPPANWLTGSKF